MLNINTDKTNVMVFGKSYNKPKVYLNNSQIDVVTTFTYLGITMNKKGRCIRAIKENINKARKAFFLLLKNAKQNYIPLNCQIDIFIKTIHPILLYGCEVWGSENCNILEKFQVKCLKTILNLRSSTPSYMIYGELGLKPLQHEIKSRMVKYWGKLISGGKNKLTNIIYNVLRARYDDQTVPSKWLDTVKRILEETGYNCLWLSPTPEYDYPYAFSEIKTRMEDQSTQAVQSDRENSSRKRHYLWLKTEWTMSPYINILDPTYAHTLLKFRSCNHKLPVEVGRYELIDYKDRLCPICEVEVGDEYHYLFTCEYFNEIRRKFIPQKYLRIKNMYTYKELLNNKDPHVLKKLCIFISHITQKLGK